jgi:hypothetical protein
MWLMEKYIFIGIWDGTQITKQEDLNSLHKIHDRVVQNSASDRNQTSDNQSVARHWCD